MKPGPATSNFSTTSPQGKLFFISSAIFLGLSPIILEFIIAKLHW